MSKVLILDEMANIPVPKATETVLPILYEQTCKIRYR